MPQRRSEKLYGHCLFPAGANAAADRPHSPVWSYRWSDARAALAALRDSGPPDPFDGYVLRYANPATGGEVLPTLGCRLQLLPANNATAAHRHTASAVYHVAEGRGYSILGGKRIDWSKGDTFAVPLWCSHQHAAEQDDVVLFSFTDEPVLRALGQYREGAAENA
jgi:gentisate 1,2-dioxygenase